MATTEGHTPSGRRAIGYIRVSSVGGRSGPGYHTLDIQRASIERTARYHQMTLVDVLTDEDQSGKTRNRPQFQIAMERVLAGDADALVVWKVSRFSRNWREAAEDVETLLDNGKDLLSEEGFDTATAGGRLLLRILFSLANWEHDVLGEHWEVIKAKAVRDRGSHLGPAPIGYVHGAAGGVLEPDPVQADLIVELFQRRADGAPWSELIDLLDKRLPRPRGRRIRKDVERIITSRTYLGEVRWREEIAYSAHTPLVTEDLWIRANTMLTIEPARPRKGPKVRDYPLSGWLICSGCMRGMGGTTFRNRHGKPLANYTCNGRRGGCPDPQTISAPPVEAWAMEQASAQYRARQAVAADTNDSEYEMAVLKVQEASQALHDLASIDMRRTLGDDWLPMMQRLRVDKATAEAHLASLGQRGGTHTAPLPWDELEDTDRWAVLRGTAPSGVLVSPPARWRDPIGRLGFILDEDEATAIADSETAQ